MIRKEVVSKTLDSVVYRGSFSTRKPSVVTMSVSHNWALVISKYLEDRKQEIETDTDIVNIELVVSKDDGQEEVIRLDVKDDAPVIEDDVEVYSDSEVVLDAIGELANV